jgi:hypothetical protein
MNSFGMLDLGLVVFVLVMVIGGIEKYNCWSCKRD